MSSGSPLPIITMFVTVRFLSSPCSKFFSVSSTSESISPAVRSRNLPFRVEAQNAQPILQPA